jgi:cysteine-rich repeat protein
VGVEECDDGNTNNNDSCLNTCNLAYCGDSVTQHGEEDCDDGNENNNDYCRNDCTLPVCGDGYQNPGEACDDGNNNSNDGCNALCVLEVCGDGIVQDGIGEVCEYDSQCDDGNYKTQDVCGETTCGCTNVQICEDECIPGEDNIHVMNGERKKIAAQGTAVL